jgi:hypothetical protein
MLGLPKSTRLELLRRGEQEAKVSKAFDADELLTMVENCLAGRVVGSNSGQAA